MDLLIWIFYMEFCLDLFICMFFIWTFRSRFFVWSFRYIFLICLFDFYFLIWLDINTNTYQKLYKKINIHSLIPASVIFLYFRTLSSSRRVDSAGCRAAGGVPMVPMWIMAFLILMFFDMDLLYGSFEIDFYVDSLYGFFVWDFLYRFLYDFYLGFRYWFCDMDFLIWMNINKSISRNPYAFIDFGFCDIPVLPDVIL